MRNVLQIVSLCCVFAGILVWLIGGARKGFYVTTEEMPRFDPITEIAYSETQRKYLPGIETLAIGLILGGSFYSISFLFSKPVNQKSKQRL